MADKRANLIISLKDEVSAGLSKIKASLAAVVAVGATFTAFLVSSVKSAIESENAVNKLNQALKNQGRFTEEASRYYQAYATQLQRTTAFSDEAVTETMALLTTFGLAGTTLKDTTKAALDLSVGLGIDLRSATLLLGKAFVGETSALSRYGIIIDDSIPQTEKFSAVMSKLNGMVGGSAAAQMDTFSGKVANLKNAFDTFKETVGGAVIPTLTRFLDTAVAITNQINRMTGAYLENKTVTEIAIIKLEEERKAIVGQAEARANARGDIVRMTEAERERVVQITDNLVQMRAAHDQEVLMLEEKLNKKSEHEAKISALEKKEIDARIKRAIKGNQDKIADDKKAFDEAVKQRENIRKQNEEDDKARVANLRSTFGQISTLSASHNKGLAAIGKAAAIAQASMDTYAAANVALRSAPPPWNFALAALVTTAGLANVARIGGVQLAQGGIVMPRSGGVPATIGEAGKAEAVIPLDDERTRDRLQASGFGGGTTIVINAGVVIGGEDTMRELAREIDKHLFEMQRSKESVAFGGI